MLGRGGKELCLGHHVCGAFESPPLSKRFLQHPAFGAFPGGTALVLGEGTELKGVLNIVLQGDRGEQLWSFPKAKLKL